MTENTQYPNISFTYQELVLPDKWAADNGYETAVFDTREQAVEFARGMEDDDA